MFLTYFFIGLASWLAASFIVGWGRLIAPNRLVGWFFFLYLVTYLIRPIPEEIHNQSVVYELLLIQGFKVVPGQMTVAVSAAILFVAVGYRFGGARGSGEEGRVTAHTVRTSAGKWLAWALLIWGYASILIGAKRGGVENVEERGFGIYFGTTGWLTESNLLISSGTTLLYLHNRRLLFSMLVATPWLLFRLASGWSRIVVIGHFFALLAIFLSHERFALSARRALHASVLAISVFLTVTVFFPAVKLYRATGESFFDLSATDLAEVFWGNFRRQNLSETTHDLFGFETTAYVLEIDQPPTWGTYYLYHALIRPVPRVLWRSKPLPPDLAKRWFGIEEDTKFFGVAPGCVGGALFAWGWLGIPFEFLLLGVFFRRIEDRVFGEALPAHWMLAYAGFFSMLPQMGRDTLLLMIADRWLFIYGLPVGMLWWLNYSRVARLFAPDPVVARLEPARR